MLGLFKPIYVFRGPWGIPVEIGASILFLVLILVDFSAGSRLLSFDLAFVAILIASIYLHELGHAWGALIQNVPVRRIVIYGGGGFCERSVSASRYEQELIVAMGPIVNLALWAGAGLIAPHIADAEIRWVFLTIAWINGFLAILNLMPVHPLDGGKLLELMMHRVLPAETVVRISAGLGLVLAVLWVPMMAGCFAMTGVALFFLPSVRQHWRLLRQKA